MTLLPNQFERLARARSDLRMGLPVKVRHDGRVGLFVPAETCSPERFEALTADEAAVLVISQRRAETLKARTYDGDIARIRIPSSAGLEWVHSVSDPAKDLTHPMQGPFASEREGSADIHRFALTVIKTAGLLPAAIVADGHGIKAPDLTELLLEEIGKILDETSPIKNIVSGRVPLQVFQDSRVHVFHPQDGGDEHYAIEIGKPNRGEPVLSRLHSACFTGDLLGSLKCDCGSQLQAALDAMAKEGRGVLLYLNQEGRGIGLANKLRAYSLQDQGFDTVEANHRLGFEDDERDLRMGATILAEMGFSSVRLMTNNPAKVAMMEAGGISVVERVPLKVGLNPHNAEYLKVKARKSGHLL